MLRPRPLFLEGAADAVELVAAPAERHLGLVCAAPLLAARKDAFVKNLTEQLFVYALGRELVPDDECAVRDVTAALARDSYRLSTLVLGDPLFAAVTGNGTINLAGSAAVFANGNHFDLPEKVYASFGSTDPTNPRPGNNTRSPSRPARGPTPSNVMFVLSVVVPSGGAKG